jgi:ABC-type dipeptide/oligopeptide/nickel transport system ATPase subunit
VGEEQVKIARSAVDGEPRVVIQERPILLSQQEIESVGVDAAGRLQLLDALRAPRSPGSYESLLASIRSLTIQLRGLSAEIATIDQQLQVLATVAAELQQAEEEAAALSKDVAATTEERERLSAIANQLAAQSVRASVFDRLHEGLNAWRGDLEATRGRAPSSEAWPDAADSPDMLVSARQLVRQAAEALEASLVSVAKALAEIARLRSVDRANEVTLSDEARALRKTLDVLKEGAGGATRRVAILVERRSQLSALTALRQQKQLQQAQLQAQRLEVLDELDRVKTERFTEREAVASALKQDLGPRINVQVLQDAAIEEYASTISSALRGSGLHYSNLAPVLAERLAPRELVESVETGNAQIVASEGGIGLDRASRIVEHLLTVGTEEILTASVEDAVEFSLLDGKEYKRTEALSTGQRCTVILPILLAYRERVLIVDEPEAHLDNGFIVGTLIKALKARPSGSQVIFATHNANIPVLGSADRVVLLGSSGDRGFVRQAGPLDDDHIVQAITTVMEGGREAFEERAKFYGSHPAQE